MDITKCSNEDCIRKTKCFRYTAKSSAFLQSFTDFKPNNNTVKEFKCQFFRSF